MILVDALLRESDAPILLPDLQGEIVEAKSRNASLGGLDRLRPSELYILLLQLESDGLLDRVPEGFIVTEAGRRRARQLRRRVPESLAVIDEAAQTIA